MRISSKKAEVLYLAKKFGYANLKILVDCREATTCEYFKTIFTLDRMPTNN